MTTHVDVGTVRRDRFAGVDPNPVRFLNTALMGTFAVVHQDRPEPSNVEKTFFIDPKESFVVFQVLGPNLRGQTDLDAVYYGWGHEPQNIVEMPQKATFAVFAFLGDASNVTEENVRNAWLGANQAPPGKIDVKPG